MVFPTAMPGLHKNSVAEFTAPDAKILIVDDTNTNLIVAKGLMQPYNMNIDLCSCGVEAIAAIKSVRYDIVFMDHMMPEMNGIEVTARIRAMRVSDDYYANVPIIALTANAVSGTKEMFIANGFDDFLSKPIDTVKLKAILNKWLPKEKQTGSAVKNRKAVIASKPIMTVIEIAGLDVNKGVLRSGGTMEMYFDTLTVFYKDGLKKIKEINSSLAAGNLSQYTIYVHALKSACANIGAEALSAAAKKLEIASEHGDLEYIEKHNAVFLLSLESMLNSIHDAIQKKQENRKDVAESLNTEAFHSVLVQLKTALEAFDARAISQTVDDLRSLAQTEDIGATINSISESILLVEYDEAIALTEALLQKVKPF